MEFRVVHYLCQLANDLRNLANDAHRAFARAHAALFDAEVHYAAMVKACDDAMFFSRHQLECFKVRR